MLFTYFYSYRSLDLFESNRRKKKQTFVPQAIYMIKMVEACFTFKIMIIEGLDGIDLITRKLLQILTVSQDMTRFAMCKDSLIAAVKWAEI